MNIIQEGSRKFVAIVLVVMISVIMFQAIGFADGTTSPLFLVYHDNPNGIFDTTVEAGGTGTITFALENAADEERTNAILIYDALTKTNGGNKILNPENYTTDLVASWFDYEAEVITLAPGENVVKQISFTVPLNTPPGNYCAIFAMYNAQMTEPAEAMDEESEIGIKINQAITQTTAIVIRVPGTYQRAMHLGDDLEYEWGQLKGNLMLSIPFTNDSTAYDFPSFTLEVLDSQNNVIYQTARKLPIVYAQTSANYLVDVSQGDWIAGDYVVHVIMTYGNNEYDGRDEKYYNLSLVDDDVKVAQKAAEEYELRTADDLDLQGFFVLDKDTLIKWGIIGGGGLLFIIILIIIIVKIAKGKKGRRTKGKRVKGKRSKQSFGYDETNSDNDMN